jgi:hypothetical protein
LGRRARRKDQGCRNGNPGKKPCLETHHTPAYKTIPSPANALTPEA